jgi:hypothetical protein
MIFGVQSATNQSPEAQSVSLTPRLMKLLQEAMKNAGLDPNELNPPAKASTEPSPKTSTEPSSFQQLFSGATAPPATSATAQQAPTVFAPKFKNANGFDSISGMTWKLNDTYFADQDTANWVAAKYGTGEIRESDVLGPGPFGVDTKMFEVKLGDGRWVNAGMLAAFYDRNPEALFPGVADKLIRSELEKA